MGINFNMKIRRGTFTTQPIEQLQNTHLFQSPAGTKGEFTISQSIVSSHSSYSNNAALWISPTRILISRQINTIINKIEYFEQFSGMSIMHHVLKNILVENCWTEQNVCRLYAECIGRVYRLNNMISFYSFYSCMHYSYIDPVRRLSKPCEFCIVHFACVHVNSNKCELRLHTKSDNC